MEYENRRQNILSEKNRKYWTFWDVSERMKANGIKRGWSIGNVKNVLGREVPTVQNIHVVKAAEEVIKIRKQIHIKDTIALKTKGEILQEYEAAVRPYLVPNN